jgi:uncharacterized damage-inducible protein DinB
MTACRCRQDGTPPAALAGRDAAFFLDLLARAAAHTRLAGQDVTDELLGHEIVRPPRPDGTVRVFDRRWVMFHMVEHAAQHLGQIRVLAREVKAANPPERHLAVHKALSRSALFSCVNASPQ